MTTKASAELLAALDVIRKNRAGLDEYMTELSLISKADQKVDDQWTPEISHSAATREEIKVGPTQRASGGGAEKMVRDYSNPAKQSGIALEAEQLARMLAPVASSMKAMAEGLTLIATTQTAILEAMKATAPVAAVKAEDKKEKMEDMDEDDDTMKSKAKEACSKSVTRAQALIKKAGVLSDAADIEIDSVKSATMKSEAIELRGKAKVEVAKASAMLLLGVDDAALVKSVQDLAKADIDGDKDDKEKREKAEDEMKKSANQADKADAEGNQDDSTVKANTDLAALKSQVDAALNGMQTLTASVSDMINHIGNSARRQPPMIPAAKGQPSAVAKSMAVLQTAIENGNLDNTDHLAASSIMGMLGRVNPEIIKARISRGSEVVQNLFEGFEPPAVEAVA